MTQYFLLNNLKLYWTVIQNYPWSWAIVISEGMGFCRKGVRYSVLMLQILDCLVFLIFSLYFFMTTVSLGRVKKTSLVLLHYENNNFLLYIWNISFTWTLLLLNIEIENGGGYFDSLMIFICWSLLFRWWLEEGGGGGDL